MGWSDGTQSGEIRCRRHKRLQLRVSNASFSPRCDRDLEPPAAPVAIGSNVWVGTRRGGLNGAGSRLLAVRSCALLLCLMVGAAVASSVPGQAIAQRAGAGIKHSSRQRAVHHQPVQEPFVIVLDPGHGGGDTGAVHRTASGQVDLMEKYLTLKIGLQAARALRRAGYTVYLTRTTDRAVNDPPHDYNRDGVFDEVDELEARVHFANAHHANLFVSIHINGSASPQDHGLTVYYCPAHRFVAKNIILARLLDRSIYAHLRNAGYTPVNKGVVSDVSDVVPQRYADYPWFFVIGPADPRHWIVANNAVSALGETLYVTNNREAALLHRPRIVRAIARGYVSGIERYFQGRSRP